MAYDVKKPGHKPAGKPIPADRIAACEQVTRDLAAEISGRRISPKSEAILRQSVVEFGPALRSLAGK